MLKKRKSEGRENIFIVLYCIYQYLTLSLYKMNRLSVPTSILPYMIPNTVAVICITDTRYQK